MHRKWSRLFIGRISIPRPPTEPTENRRDPNPYSTPAARYRKPTASDAGRFSQSCGDIVNTNLKIPLTNIAAAAAIATDLAPLFLSFRHRLQRWDAMVEKFLVDGRYRKYWSLKYLAIIRADRDREIERNWGGGGIGVNVITTGVETKPNRLVIDC